MMCRLRRNSAPTSSLLFSILERPLTQLAKAIREKADINLSSCKTGEMQLVKKQKWKRTFNTRVQNSEQNKNPR